MGTSSTRAKGSERRYEIRFPETRRREEQDAEFCEINLAGQWWTVRLHDYHEIYKHPGLYEQLFCERLRCTSPEQVAGLLGQTLRERGVDPASLRAIDLGAGNGMVGQQLRSLGIDPIVGVDILPEAQMAAMRDRAECYADYIIADLTDLREAEGRRLVAHDPNVLVTVAALGFGDIPARAFATAFNAIATPGWLAFNIRDAFLNTSDRSGFSRLIHAMTGCGVVRIEAWRRYVHRLSIDGRPIEYIAIIARKLADLPAALVQEIDRSERAHAKPTPRAPAGKPMIEFHNVSKSYGDEADALIDFDLTIHAGELVALVGDSGSGKTTALKLINRLLDPTRGTVHVEGKDVRFEDPIALRRGIGYVFQQVGLFPHMTVGENIATTPKLLRWKPVDVAARVDELLGLVGLPPDEYRLRRPSELSGGQQQRVGFARALAAMPSTLLLDEPFGALDPITRDGLQREFALIHRQLKLTSILVTHDMAEALLLADRIAVMRGGRLLQVGTPHELLAAPANRYVESLLDTPRKQAERLERLVRGPTDEDDDSLFSSSNTEVP